MCVLVCLCVCETQSILKDGCVKHLYPLCRARHREGIRKAGKQRRALQRQSNWGESWLFLILWGGCCIRPQNEPQQQRTTEDERGGCKGFKIFSKRTWRANDSKGTGRVLGELGNCKMNTDYMIFYHHRHPSLQNHHHLLEGVGCISGK